ncbi:MAG: hypothetical protein A2293_10960 [Elusimicrobia bacterium RIFOXYB2_FULL_49_7]|nr:MAG: hypothetical protein A2293_10960 [Elusimicrobia bacterium RIFOXYB2_FULL_49_7]
MMNINSVENGANSAPKMNLEIKKRDLNQEVMKKTLGDVQIRREKELKQASDDNAEKREMIRMQELESRKTLQARKESDQIQENAIKRQDQERRNPSKGDIINYIA